MTVPKVFAAIAAVSADLAKVGVPKARTNAQDQYTYRSIDDVTQSLSPLLAKHRLCILPRVIERTTTDRPESTGDLLVNVVLKVAFDLISVRDGSMHTVEAYGEALDAGDKATSKAMSSAFKQAALVSFCVPCEANNDVDAFTHRLQVRKKEPADPRHGWDDWSTEVRALIDACESSKALDLVQSSHRDLIRAVSKRRPDIFSALGIIIRDKRAKLKLLEPAQQESSRKGISASAANVREVSHA